MNTVPTRRLPDNFLTIPHVCASAIEHQSAEDKARVYTVQDKKYKRGHTSRKISTGCTKKPQTIENNPLLEFQWPSTKLNPRVNKLLT